MKKLLVILNSITLIAVIIFNGLAASGKIYSATVGEISHKYNTLFAPADYAFSIWSLIYIALIAFVGFQWYSVIKKTNLDLIDRTGVYLIIINLANMLWLILWLKELIGFSVIVMLLLLLTLIILSVKLDLEIWDAPVRIIMFVWWPLAFYLGWIIVAAVANISAFFISVGWNGSPLTQQLWTEIMIVIAAAIYLFITFTRNLRESAVVGIWALVAIAVKQWNSNIEISYTALGAAAILLAAIIYHASKNIETAPILKLRRGEF